MSRFFEAQKTTSMGPLMHLSNNYTTEGNKSQIFCTNSLHRVHFLFVK